MCSSVRVVQVFEDLLQWGEWFEDERAGDLRKGRFGRWSEVMEEKVKAQVPAGRAPRARSEVK